MVFALNSHLSEPAAAYQDMNVILHSSRPEYLQREEVARTSTTFGLYINHNTTLKIDQ